MTAGVRPRERGPLRVTEGRGESEARRQMVERLVALGAVRDPRLVAAFREVPRHLFVPPALSGQAYADHALPIGAGQTITQPANVAKSLELLDLPEAARVLEIGTGSGYQTAILSRVAGHVFSLERISSLADGARALLGALGVANVSVRVFDGSYGWAEQGPYDGIVVSAAAPAVPERLVEQLRPSGRLVVPVGDGARQRLLLVRRLPSGRTRTEDAGEVGFVPLVGRFGFPPPGEGDAP